MKTSRLPMWGAVAGVVFSVCGQQTIAQQATAQFYGYPSNQAPMASGQGLPSGQGGCYVEKWGCNVSNPCPPSGQNPQIPVPGLESPSCQNAIPILNEMAPPPPRTVTIFRNHYVPIRIQNVPTPVQPVNIEVRWREIHYLCDCPPGTSQCPHIPTGTPQMGAADQPESGEPTALASVTPAPAAAPATPEPAPVAQANTPAKQWVWLQAQGLYGFGYQRPDGRWVIDPNSKRPTLPAGIVDANEQPAANPTVAAVAGR